MHRFGGIQGAMALAVAGSAAVIWASWLVLEAALALSVGALALARFRAHGRRADLVLGAAFSLVGATVAGLAVGPELGTTADALTGVGRTIGLGCVVLWLYRERCTAAGLVRRAEQRRMAAELHAGMGNLAYITAQSRWLAARSSEVSGPLTDLADAAEEALGQVRASIRGLHQEAAGAAHAPAGWAPPPAPGERGAVEADLGVGAGSS